MPEIALDEEYRNGVLIRSVQRTVTDAEIRARNAEQRLRAGRTQLRQIRDQAQAASSGGAFASLAAASTAIRQLAGATATLAQTLMDIELILAFQQDDGSD